MARLFKYIIKFWIKSTLGGTKVARVTWPLPRKYVFSLDKDIWKEVTFAFMVDPLEIETAVFISTIRPAFPSNFFSVDPTNEQDLIEIKDIVIEESEVEINFGSQDLQTL